jgi:hypothetical protein
MSQQQMEDYLFDLHGFIRLDGALDEQEVAALNDCIDGVMPLAPGEWHGHVHSQEHSPKFGINLQQIYEAGPPFETLIDHPSWIDKVKRYVGGEGTFDYNHGPLYVDENFANLRCEGQAISLHSGGHTHCQRTRYEWHDGRWHCGQINILMALTDIGPGDGATVVIPGSHKSNLAHPHFATHSYGTTPCDGVVGAVECHMQAGDALLFVDAICHGSAARVTPGERRIVVYRYGPSWGRSRHGYTASPELLARLTDQQRSFVLPGPQRQPPAAGSDG